MPFFIPSRLVEYEYYETSPTDEEYMRIAKPYQYDIGFAFFAANLGYSLSDYEELTPVQRALILKELELKEVKEDNRINAAVINAIANANRPKNRAYKPLWKKNKKAKPTNKEEMKEKISIVQRMEDDQGKSWVDKIYVANGIERRKNG